MNPFRPIPSHSATESQSFRFSVKIFRRSPLDGGRERWQVPKIFFSPGHWTSSRRSCFKQAVLFVVLVPTLSPILGHSSPVHLPSVYLFTVILIYISNLRQGLLSGFLHEFSQKNLACISRIPIDAASQTSIFNCSNNSNVPVPVAARSKV